MDNALPFPVFGLEDDEIEMFSRTINKLREKYTLSFGDPIAADLKIFSVFNDYAPAEIRESLGIQNMAGDLFVNFIHVSYSYAGRRGGIYHSSEYQAWGSCMLRNNFGHVFIKNEGLSEKVQELIQHIELDFEEDKLFSNKFYVLADDKLKAVSAISAAFRQLVLDVPLKEIFIEIVGKQLLIGSKHMIEPGEALLMADFISKAAKL